MTTASPTDWYPVDFTEEKILDRLTNMESAIRALTALVDRLDTKISALHAKIDAVIKERIEKTIELRQLNRDLRTGRPHRFVAMRSGAVE